MNKYIILADEYIKYKMDFNNKSLLSYSISKVYNAESKLDTIDIKIKYGDISMTQIIDDNNDIQHIINYFKIFRDEILLLFDSILSLGHGRMILNDSLISIFIDNKDPNKFKMYPWKYDHYSNESQNITDDDIGTDINILELLTQMDCLDFSVIPSGYYISDYRDPNDYTSFDQLTLAINNLIIFYNDYIVNKEKEISESDIILEQDLYNKFTNEISCDNYNIQVLDKYQYILCIDPNGKYVLTKEILEDCISQINTNRELFYSRVNNINEKES